jgi:bifunctional non-homologous end joining protein LigD
VRQGDAFPIVAFVEKLGARPRKIASFYVGRRDGDRRLNAFIRKGAGSYSNVERIRVSFA